ncbi:hypothetical protein Pcinc_015042 [Petrolisthes cinctipes]|uniref:Retinol dehydrogenase 11 n=1 Tax=Petrolisthes cinctipes TaxID=88211 RepID=A0AAE1FU57_PETCI|nr:hypothetical protein Pcinc_015042 [Petrolisthes cinctipes]
MLFEVLVTVVMLVVSVRVWYLTTSGRCHSTRSMKGKTVVVTGGSAGIGLHTAEDLVRRGARVILACRNLEKACKLAAQLKAEASQCGEVAVRRLDTSDLNSVRTFAKEILDTEKHIHVLINNAGIVEPPEKVMTNEGLELTMATNHFGHFLLTNLLLGVTANSLHPGIVKTDILIPYHTMFGRILKLVFILWAKDSELGAQTNIYLAVSEEVEGVSGRYFTDCKEVKTSKLARDKDLAKRLWEVSEKAVKLRPGENVCLGADEDEASGWDGLAAAGTANGSTSVLLPADDSAVQAAAGSTSRVPVYPEQHAETLYLMDEGELQHRQKMRQLELTLLEEKIKAQRAITVAMRLIAQVCEKIME